MKLGFFANTQQAKHFRQWAATVLSSPELSQRSVQSLETQRVAQLEAALLVQNPRWSRLMRMVAAGLVTREMAAATGMSLTTTERNLREMRSLGLIGKRKPVRINSRVLPAQLPLLEG